MLNPNLTRRTLVTALAGVALTASLGVLAQGFQVHYRVAGIVPASEPVPEISFTSHTFTNCGAEGRYGPGLQSCLNAYAQAEMFQNESSFDVTGGIQHWTVPTTGKYLIQAHGAQGGGDIGGRGASIGGEFEFEEGESLKIIVGQRGLAHSGGGASFIWKSSSNTLLMAAGGGGGASSEDPGKPGVSSANGTAGNLAYHGAGGLNGMAGQPSGNSKNWWDATGGAGWGGNPVKSSINQYGTPQEGVGDPAKRPLSGGIGAGGFQDDARMEGGFGGGGGSAGTYGHLSVVGGGGGGYSGGGAGGNVGGSVVRGGGGGGGSFNAGTNQSNQSGANSGHGRVTITLLSQ